jgi:hypothetical protein
MPIAVRIAPFVTLGALIAWTASDVLAVAEPRLFQAFAALLAIGGLALGLGNLPGWRWAQPGGLIALGLSYLGAHVIVLGVDVVAGLAFVTFLFIHVEARSAAERFAPVYARSLEPDERGRVNAALGRMSVRVGFAGGLGFLLPLLAADLALTGIAGARTIPSAVLLAAAIVLVVSLLALLPVLERRTT